MMDFKMEESLGFVLNRTAAKMKNNLNQSFKPFDVTTEQWRILNRLWEKDGVSQRELSEKSCKDQPNVTRILDKLEEKEFIERQPDPEDRRASLVYLTDRGRDLKAKLVPVALENLDKALKGVNTNEVELVKALLNRIFCNLEDI